MKTIRFLVASLVVMLAFGLGSCTSSKYDYQTVENDPLNAKIYTLPNGLKVYMTVNKEQPRIQTFIAVRTGGKNDPAETTGLAHYLEHLMFKGTTHFGTQDYEAEKPLLDSITALYEIYRIKTDEAERKALYHQIDSISGVAARYAIPNEYDKLMSIIGANGTNAYTSEDVTCYTEDIPSNQIENWAKVQSDRFMNPVFRLFHTELESVYEEKNISMTNDSRKVYEKIAELLCPHHPYGQQSVIGTQEHLKNPSLVNIRNYFDTWYVPNNVAICLSGDFDPDYMVDIITRYFGEWKPSAGVPQNQWPAEDPVTSPIECDVLGQEAENITLAWRFGAATQPETEMAEFVCEVLSNGKAGIFDLDLNQAQAMQAAYSYFYDAADYNSLVFFGYPNPGQSLEECRSLLLAELAKLRAGDFADDLIPSVITDIKLNRQRRLEENYSRADMFVQSFINGQAWSDVVGYESRLDKITKEDVVAFANEYLKDTNFACIYKRQGEDPDVQRIDKPAITPIDANRDAVSAFVQEIQSSEVAPIEPVFVDYQKDLQLLTLDQGQQLIYKANETNQRFSLIYLYEMGSWADKVLPYVSNYSEYLGTSEYTPAELSQKFYMLGCTMNITCANRRFYVQLSGLNENLEAAVQLLDKVLQDAQPDESTYQTFVAQIIKERDDVKFSQRYVYSALDTYASYGSDYIRETKVSNEELAQLKSNDLTDRIHNLANLQHKVLYFGPSSEAEIQRILNANHRSATELQPVPANVLYQYQPTPKNVLYFAPYTANNSILGQTSNTGMAYSADMEPAVTMYGEYFGGSMNGIVFQEMRETRGLAYTAWAYFRSPSNLSDLYTMKAQITTQNDKLQEAYTHFNEIIDDMPQSETAYTNAKTALIARMRTERTTRSAVLWNYIDAQELGLTEDPNKSVYEHIGNLTLEDIVRFQQENVRGRHYAIRLVSDPKQVDLKFFETIGEVKRLTLEEIFGY